MKVTKIRISALIVLGMFAGLASAETPDACDNWDCGKLFGVPNNDYAFEDGVLTSSPVDGVDMWKSNDPNVGDTLLVYLDYDAVYNGLTSELFTGGHKLMQRIKLNENVYVTATLNATPTYVQVKGFPRDYDYTFALSRNV